MNKIPGRGITNGRRVGAAVLIIGIVISLGLAFRFIKHRMEYAVTDAVFVRTDNLITLGFDNVGGRLSVLTKAEGDPVEKGESIAIIDSENYRLAAERAAGELNATRREIENREIFLERLKKEVVLKEDVAYQKVTGLKSEVAALQASVRALDPVIRPLERDHRRFSALYDANAVAKRRAEEIETELAVKREEREGKINSVEAVKARLRAAEKELLLAKTKRMQIRETEKSIDALNEKMKALEARLEKAKRDLDQCVLKSPVRGRVAKKYVSAGDVVSPGIPVYALVDPADIYVLVLLEENKLRGVKEGCHAIISIDAYPGEVFEGTVSRVLPASAATFALIPSDISAGEFTKVAQRVPVKIRITKGDTSLLRIGLGGEVEIKRAVEK